MRRALACACAAAALAACAAEQRGVSPTNTPAGPAPSMIAPQDQSGSAEPPGAAARSAKGELARAEAELASAGADCAAACRALGSMERATAHLCQLAASPEDQRACDDARARLESSRARVKNTCGECGR